MLAATCFGCGGGERFASGEEEGTGGDAGQGGGATGGTSSGGSDSGGTSNGGTSSGGTSSGGTSSGGTSGGSSGSDTGGSGGGEPVDVSGTYTVAITNGPAQSNRESCPAAMWMEGMMATGLTLTIMQSGSAVTGRFDGGTGLTLWAGLGAAEFSGSVTGSDVHMVIFGTRVYMEGTCSYTVNATSDATLQGNALSGTVFYEAIFSNDPACEGIVCEATQEYSGSRPPR